MAICPEAYSVSPESMAWLYGPTAAGALGVLITFVMFEKNLFVGQI